MFQNREMLQPIPLSSGLGVLYESELGRPLHKDTLTISISSSLTGVSCLRNDLIWGSRLPNKGCGTAHTSSLTQGEFNSVTSTFSGKLRGLQSRNQLQPTKLVYPTYQLSDTALPVLRIL